MNRSFQLIAFIMSYLFMSCSSGNSKLVIQNFGSRDSIMVDVSLNGNQIFHNRVPRAVSNFDAVGSEFLLAGKVAHFRVSIPALNYAGTVDTNIVQLKKILVVTVIRTEYTHNTTVDGRDTITAMKPKISISIGRDIELKGKAI